MVRNKRKSRRWPLNFSMIEFNQFDMPLKNERAKFDSQQSINGHVTIRLELVWLNEKRIDIETKHRILARNWQKTIRRNVARLRLRYKQHFHIVGYSTASIGNAIHVKLSYFLINHANVMCSLCARDVLFIDELKLRMNEARFKKSHEILHISAINTPPPFPSSPKYYRPIQILQLLPNTKKNSPKTLLRYYSSPSWAHARFQ